MSSILKDEEFLPAALLLIAGAKKSIYISTFKAEITNKTRSKQLTIFFETLVQKADAGVDVRLLINVLNVRGHIPASNAVALRILQPTTIKTRHLPNNRVCHAKLLIVDEKTAICGSHNLSVKSSHYNFELSCVLTKGWSLLQLVKVFEDLWDASQAT